ncbi:MAG: hypothetical protein V5A51_11090 [Bacteroidales bacterium]
MIKQTSKPQRLVRGTGPGTMEHSVSMMIKFATPSITRVAALSALVTTRIMLTDIFAA